MDRPPPKDLRTIRNQIHLLLGHPCLTQDDIAAIEEAMPPTSTTNAQELLFVLEAKIHASIVFTPSPTNKETFPCSND